MIMFVRVYMCMYVVTGSLCVSMCVCVYDCICVYVSIFEFFIYVLISKYLHVYILYVCVFVYF